MSDFVVDGGRGKKGICPHCLPAARQVEVATGFREGLNVVTVLKHADCTLVGCHLLRFKQFK